MALGFRSVAAGLTVASCFLGRVGVDQCGGELWDGVGEAVFGVVSDLVRVGKAQCAIDVEFGVGVEPVADPPHLDTSHSGDARFGGQRGFGGVDEFGVYAVEAVGGTRRVRRCGTARIAMVIRIPMMGSASGKPRAMPPAPRSTANEVNPSVRA